ncbi:MAG: hypothetical protein K0M50_03430 [Prolixibacteraceae bacterium]|nr:hypothetical protein [Prolixibacteraceae bacterium]
MRKIYLILVIILFGAQIELFAQEDGGVSIGKGTEDAHPSAILELVSSNKGLLIPRLTSTERQAISSPASGLLVYDTNLANFQYWTGIKWSAVPGVSFTSGATVPLKAMEGDLFYNTIDDKVQIYVASTWKDVGSKAQVLQLNSTTLKLLEAGKATGSEVDLSAFMQSLSLDGSKLTISGKNTVDLKDINTDKQTLSLSGTILSITDGGAGVDFAPILSNTTASNVKVTPTAGITSTNVQAALQELRTSIYSRTDNDNQQLSVTGNKITISNGNTITLPAAVTGGDMTMTVYDTNGNNKVDVAESVVDGAVTATKLNQMSATSGQVLGWNGSVWEPTSVSGTDDKVKVAGSATAKQLSNTDFDAAGTDIAIKNGAITTTKIAADAVETAKVKDGAITPLKLDGISTAAPGASYAITSNGAGGFQWTDLSSGVPVNAGNIDLAQGSILVGNSSDNAVAIDAKGNAKILIGNGTTVTSQSLVGDVSMTNTGAVTVTQIQGKPVSATAPNSGQVLTYNGSQWIPGAAGSTVADASPTVKGIVMLTGDLAGTASLPTLATTGVTAASYGSLTAIPTFTVDAKGRLTTANTVSATNLAIAGDVTGTLGSATVAKLQGKSISTTAPINGQVLTYNGTQWIPANGSTVSDASTTVKGIVQLTGDLAGTADGVTVAKIQGSPVSNATPITGQVLYHDGSNWVPSDGAGISIAGDVTGNLGEVTVSKIQGTAVSATAPTLNGQVLSYNSTTKQWVPLSLASSSDRKVGVGISDADPAQLDPAYFVNAGSATSGIAIKDAAVTYSKIQNVSAAKLLGRNASTAGAPEEITIGDGLSLNGTTLSISKNVVFVTTPTYTVLPTDYCVISNYVGSLTVVLPTPDASMKGRELVFIEDTGGGPINFSGALSGQAVPICDINAGIRLFCSGVKWYNITGY